MQDYLNKLSENCRILGDELMRFCTGWKINERCLGDFLQRYRLKRGYTKCDLGLMQNDGIKSASCLKLWQTKKQ